MMTLVRRRYRLAFRDLSGHNMQLRPSIKTEPTLGMCKPLPANIVKDASSSRPSLTDRPSELDRAGVARANTGNPCACMLTFLFGKGYSSSKGTLPRWLAIADMCFVLPDFWIHLSRNDLPARPPLPILAILTTLQRAPAWPQLGSIVAAAHGTTKSFSCTSSQESALVRQRT